jgi:hypothetical protein
MASTAPSNTVTTDLKHIIGAGGCWCGYSIEEFQAGGLTHTEHADLFAGIRRHVARFTCGHTQPFLCPPIIGWADWCEQCRDMRWVIDGCDCPRFDAPPKFRKHTTKEQP